MPELPDITIYVEALTARIVGQRLDDIRLRSSFLVRTVDPPLRAVVGKRALRVGRLGKRVVIEFEDDLALAFHLMVSGRLHWQRPGAAIPRRRGLVALDFEEGTLLLTEASTKQRAALHLVRGAAGLAELDAGGIEVLESDLASFRAALARENHTLKRALTDPRIFSGIGNAYSDEILHRARLSPVRLSQSLSAEQVAELHSATQAVLREWTARLREECGTAFPEKVTAFHAEMAVHGKFGRPCPCCGSPVQRIRHAENETNYCATCQNEGRLLADRSLSRLLKQDWPRSLDEMEQLKQRLR